MHIAFRTCFSFALVLAALILPAMPALAAEAGIAPATELRYLSGHGPRDAVPWEFKVSDGRRAGEWATLPVPSQWEQHGFGGYDYGEGPQQNTEHGLYRLRFRVPPAWRGKRVRLVFEGVMTEASVKINGVSAGPTHVGGFYRFRYDVTPLLRFGEDGADGANLLEVDVNKRATDALTNIAETKGDYWIFGGIFRPVWLEATPTSAIDHVAIDARADGAIAATVRVDDAAPGTRVKAQIIDAAGRAAGPVFSAAVANGDTVLHGSLPAPRLWSAETPNLYTLKLWLAQDGKPLHETSRRFGFRSFEVRKGVGLFLNGQRILIKGVNRHSFRPESGRTLDPEDSYADARLIKQMNMNTARMSHYPPDPAFLEAADELGLYVLDELSGWQRAHGTEIGKRLVRELIERDVNHPSILFWDNGNEGGWNRELDGEFALYDPQRRPVLHPWELHGDVDTKHYPDWALLNARLQGPNLLMPTEFLHALYDGGGGAGLADYWKAITGSPYGAGAIFWVLADEGIARSDLGGKIDVYGSYDPDGLVGPHHEKEGSFYAIRHIWSPIQIDPVADMEQAARSLTVRNAYDFRSLADCRFSWQLLRYPGPDDAARGPVPKPRVLAEGKLRGPAIAPHSSGAMTLKLPPGWQAKRADALALTAYGPDGNAVWTWTFAARATGLISASTLAQTPAPKSAPAAQAAVRVERSAGRIDLVAGGARAGFDARTGLLLQLSDGARTSPLTNGPRLAYARPSAAAPTWLPLTASEAGCDGNSSSGGEYRLASAQPANALEVEPAFTKEIAYASLRIEISPDGRRWRTIFDGPRRASDGLRYAFPPQTVLALRVTGVADQLGRPVPLKAVRLAYEAERFPAADAPPVAIRSGVTKDGNSTVAYLEADGAGGLERARWRLDSGGTLSLDYSYALEGRYLYHGVSFDHPEQQMTRLRWLGEGPYRVWQNRLAGTWLGVHETAYNDIQPGVSFGYPEFQGMYARVQWARLGNGSDGGGNADLVMRASGADGPGYLRVGTPRVSHAQTSVEFPAGDISWLHAIPAIGSKFIWPDKLGPGSVPASAAGHYQGKLQLRLALPESPSK